MMSPESPEMILELQIMFRLPGRQSPHLKHVHVLIMQSITGNFISLVMILLSFPLLYLFIYF